MEDNNKAPQTIDLSYLNEISKGDKAFTKKMIGLFLSENPNEIRALNKGIIESNFEMIQMAANNLRSTIPFLGLNKIIENEVVKVESLAIEKTALGEIKMLFAKIKDVCERACAELQLV